MGKFLRQPKLWITLASLIFIAVALAQQAGQLRQLSLVANGWWWLVLGLGLTWLSILINGLAWRDLLIWLRHPPQGVAVVPLFVRSNLLKYLPGGIWHLVERVRVLRPAIGGGPALAGVILDPLLIVAASVLVVVAGGWQQGPAAIHPQPQQERTPPRSGVDQGSPQPGQGRRQSPDAARGPAPPNARSLPAGT